MHERMQKQVIYIKGSMIGCSIMRIFFGILYLFLCGATGRVMGNLGFDLNDWQWWFCCGSVWVSFLCGFLVEKFRQKGE